MLQKLSPWLAAGLTSGLVILLGIWLIAIFQFNTFILNNRSTIDQKLVAAVIEASATNPEIQTMLRNQVILYLKSPEGKAKMAELIKSPEMVTAMSENIQSPEVRKAIIKIMEIPEFRNAVLQIIKDTPEMKTLALISSAITFNQEPTSNPPGPSPNRQ